jgi:transcriptional regulator with XRE-family HTH domain
VKRTSYGERDYAFGQLMLTLRTSIGLTQAGLAGLLGVSRQALGEWETGSSYPKAEHLKQFIALGVQQQAFAASREAEESRAARTCRRWSVRAARCTRWPGAQMGGCSPVAAPMGASGCGTRPRACVCRCYRTLRRSTPSSWAWPGVQMGASWHVEAICGVCRCGRCQHAPTTGWGVRSRPTSAMWPGAPMGRGWSMGAMMALCMCGTSPMARSCYGWRDTMGLSGAWPGASMGGVQRGAGAIPGGASRSGLCGGLESEWGAAGQWRQ